MIAHHHSAVEGSTIAGAADDKIGEGPAAKPAWRWAYLQINRPWTVVLSALLLVGGGCGRNQIRSYQAPKDAVPGAPAAAAAEGESGAPQVTWKLPAGWQEQAPAPMRLGSFRLTGPKDQKAEVSIVPLGGMAGGDLENVNRWRGQVSLGRIDQAEFDKLAEAVEIGGQSGQLFDLSGTTPDEGKPMRILGAIQHRNGRSWFFKMTGDPELVADQKGVFRDFLKGLVFGAGSAAPPQMAAAPPAGPFPGGPSAPGANPKWTVPSAWQEQSAGPMQTARFVATEGQNKAEVTVSVLPGDAGGELANVNRWRGQVDLPPVTETDLGKFTSALDLGAGQGRLVDLSGEKTPRRLVAVIVAQGGNTWFYKLLGDEAVVARERAAFIKFVQSAKYGS